MPVGAGSIRRAAKTAGGAKSAATDLQEAASKAVEEPEVIMAGAGEDSEAEVVQDMTKTATVRKKSKSKASGEKSGKKSKKETSGKKAAKREEAAKKPESKGSGKKAGKKSAVLKSAGQYEAYSIGQPLPVHLL